MEAKKEGQIILKQWFRMAIVIVLIAILITGIYLVTKSFIPASNEKKTLASYSYNANINYKVYLKDNKFFPEKSLGMNGQYITSIIDYIEVSPRYDLQSTVPLDFKYSYQIIATAKSTYSTDEKQSEVWSKAYTILPLTNKTTRGTNVSINETVKIDYNKYNNILLDFKKQFGLSVDAEVDVVLKIVINASDPNNEKIKFSESKDLTLLVPLLNPTTKITSSYSPEGKKDIYDETKKDTSFDITYFCLGVALLALSAFLLIKAIRELFVATRKSEYVLEYNRIMKNYGDIIAEAENAPDLSKYDVIDINSFDDLVDIESELRNPILCVETVKDYESWFIILHDKSAYRFILKHETLLKINRD